MATFHKVTLTEIPNNEVLKFAYGRFPKTRALEAVQKGEITLEQRIGDGTCECGGTDWMILPLEMPSVSEGGKSYIECITCGHITHL